MRPVRSFYRDRRPISSSGCISYARGHIEETHRIAASDPYIEVGDSSYELSQWNIR